jgi:hypothetical protein
LIFDLPVQIPDLRESHLIILPSRRNIVGHHAYHPVLAGIILLKTEPDPVQVAGLQHDGAAVPFVNKPCRMQVVSTKLLSGVKNSFGALSVL